jgi:hypothetical protein
LYKGRAGNGFFWLALVACFWFVMWPLAVVIHLACIYDAAKGA